MNLRQKNKKLKQELERYKSMTVPVLNIKEQHRQVIIPCVSVKRYPLEEVTRFSNYEDQQSYIDLLSKDVVFRLDQFLNKFVTVVTYEDKITDSIVVEAKLDIVVHK
jgi:hypothetical protein